MRAQNQQDLIYKRGQAGVTKASVTIVFDNSDRATSPAGFENCKQITVTRQIALPNLSKYLLNGHKSQQQAIQTLFQSVQLNINNPNFVIMQGRITKVLNMKPPEILSLVEEAAGTRMFEDRKTKALKTIAKKQTKVDEITVTLNEDVKPKLDKLKKEKEAYLEFQKNETELEKLSHKFTAWEWWDSGKKVAEKGRAIEEKTMKVEQVKKSKEQLANEIGASEKRVIEVTKQRDAELKKGGKLTKLEERVKELDKELTKMKTQEELKASSIKEETSRAAAIKEQIAEV